MGCCLSVGAELPAATEEDLKRLKEKGFLPCLAGPSIDFEGKNQCATVYIAGEEIIVCPYFECSLFLTQVYPFFLSLHDRI